MRCTIQSLWLGERLSPLERLCAYSFMRHGHEFHLYAYNELVGVPEGVVMKDANEIIPQKKVFVCRRGSFAVFSDWFRWALLYRRGGWWVDMDVVCLKPFVFDSPIVFSGDRTILSVRSKVQIGCCYTHVLAFPANHMFCAWMERCCAHPNRFLPYDSWRNRVRKTKRVLQRKGKEFTRWGESGGPRGFTQALKHHNLLPHAQSYEVFSPYLAFPRERWRKILLEEFDGSAEVLFPDSYAFHAENEYLRREGYDKSSPFPENSLLGRLNNEYEKTVSVKRHA